MLTLKLSAPSAATPGAVGDVRRLTGGVVLGAVAAAFVAVGEDAGAAEEAASLTLTAGKLVAGLATGLADKDAGRVARAAGVRAATSRHGCTTSATTATTTTTLTALVPTTPYWPCRNPNFAAGMVTP